MTNPPNNLEAITEVRANLSECRATSAAMSQQLWSLSPVIGLVDNLNNSGIFQIEQTISTSNFLYNQYKDATQEEINDNIVSINTQIDNINQWLGYLAMISSAINDAMSP